jgi:hypothetical protein
MSEGKFMNTLYNQPIQNMNKEEAEAYSSGQNKGILGSISMIPIGRGIQAGASILSKAPALAKAIRAFTNAPKQYLSLATRGVNVGDKAKKINTVRDVATTTPARGGFSDPTGKIIGGTTRSGTGNVSPIISNNKVVNKLPKLSEAKNLDDFLGL